MADAWYEAVAADAGILQGDLILDCPLVAWKSDLQIQGEGKGEELANQFEIVAEDIVVMTQACDLEQHKVNEVVVCSMHTLDELKKL